MHDDLYCEVCNEIVLQVEEDDFDYSDEYKEEQ